MVGGTVVKNLPANAGDVGDLGLIPGLGRSPGVWNSNPFSGGSDGKKICLQSRTPGFDPWVGKIPWRREWQPSPVFLTGKFHGQRSLACYNPWGHRVGHDWAHILANTQQRTFAPQIPEIIRSIVLEPHFRSTASPTSPQMNKIIAKSIMS